MGLLSNLERGLENYIEGIFKNRAKASKKKRSPKKESDFQIPKLVVIAGPHRGETFFLKEGETFIGRIEGAPQEHYIILKDNSVSRRHAKVQFSGGKVSIHDLGSTNGVYINGHRIKSKILEPKDIISLGRTVLIFEVE
ncbi:MAG: putative signaling protein [Clostridia bacterium 41_269]|nr:MAG: putative signaling protein [Clostridia bacterium 41_269]